MISSHSFSPSIEASLIAPPRTAEDLSVRGVENWFRASDEENVFPILLVNCCFARALFRLEFFHWHNPHFTDNGITHSLLRRTESVNHTPAKKSSAVRGGASKLAPVKGDKVCDEIIVVSLFLLTLTNSNDTWETPSTPLVQQTIHPRPPATHPQPYGKMRLSWL